MTPDDYPVAALRADEQGVTAFVLAIDPFGRVTGCEISASSGSATLDAATCDLITRRARFFAARDAAGKPTSGTYANRVRWVLPEPEPFDAPFLDANGKPLRKRVSVTVRSVIEDSPGR